MEKDKTEDAAVRIWTRGMIWCFKSMVNASSRNDLFDLAAKVRSKELTEDQALKEFDKLTK